MIKNLCEHSKVKSWICIQLREFSYPYFFFIKSHWFDWYNHSCSTPIYKMMISHNVIRKLCYLTSSFLDVHWTLIYIFNDHYLSIICIHLDSFMNEVWHPYLRAQMIHIGRSSWQYIYMYIYIQAISLMFQNWLICFLIQWNTRNLKDRIERLYSKWKTINILCYLFI